MTIHSITSFPESLKPFLKGEPSFFEDDIHNIAKQCLQTTETSSLITSLSQLRFTRFCPQTLLGLTGLANYFNLKIASKFICGLSSSAKTAHKIDYLANYTIMWVDQSIYKTPFNCLIRTVNLPNPNALNSIYDQLLKWEQPKFINENNILPTWEEFSSEEPYLKRIFLKMWFWTPFLSQGTCAGASFWFNFVYLMNNSSENDPEILLKKIATLFALGSPKEALFFQHFLYELSHWSFNTTNPNTKPVFAFFLKDSSSIDLIPENDEKMLEDNHIIYQNIDVLKTIPNGCYLLDIPLISSCKHVMSLIKISSELIYIFDINQGLIKFEGPNLNEQIHQFLNHHLEKTKGYRDRTSRGTEIDLFTSYQQDKETAQSKGENLNPADYSKFYIKIIPFKLEKD